MIGYRSPMFERFSGWVADATGKPLTFALSVILVVVWAITGPMFDYNDTWQLIINTATTITVSIQAARVAKRFALAFAAASL